MHLLLFAYKRELVVDVAEKFVALERLGELLLAALKRIAELIVARLKRLLLLDDHRRIEVAVAIEIVGRLANRVNTIGVRIEVAFEERKLLLQIHHRAQILAVIGARQRAVELGEIKSHIVDAPIERLLVARLVELDAFSACRFDELRPEGLHFGKTLLDVISGVVASGDERLAGAANLVEAIMICAQLLLVVCVFLEFAANVGRIEVAVVFCRLELLVYPAEHLVAVAIELLQPIRLFEALATLLGTIEQLLAAIEQRASSCCDLIGGVMRAFDQLCRKLVERMNFLLLRCKRLLEILVLLEKRLNAVERVAEIVVGQKRLLFVHPIFCLRRVSENKRTSRFARLKTNKKKKRCLPVEKLHIHILLKQNSPLLPERLKLRLLLGKLAQIGAHLVGVLGELVVE